MIVLPAETAGFPWVRIHVMAPGHWTDETQPWTTLAEPLQLDREGATIRGVAQGAYHLQFVRRCTLPEVDTACFFIDHGTVNNTTVTPQDLSNYAVRIQIAGAPLSYEEAGTPSWRTIFLGRVIAWTDTPFVGRVAGGRRIYQCMGLLDHLRQWPMGRHTHRTGTGVTQANHAWGHPGYNYGLDGWFRRVLGNRASGAYATDPYGDMGGTNPITGQPWTYDYGAHILPGDNGSTDWTDSGVVRHALASTRARGEPLIALDATAGLLDGSFAWPVQDGQSCLDFLAGGILRRQRGRGISYLDWIETITTGSDAPGNIQPILRVRPQNGTEITYAKPAAGTTSIIPSASAAGNVAEVDLNGDRRLVDGSLVVVNRANAVYDYVETRGEPIEVLVTLAGIDSTLEKRWSAAEETIFNALTDPWKRQSERWRYVHRRWSLPQEWDLKVGNGNGATPKTRCDWRCGDTGAIATPTAETDTSVSGLRINSTLPLYEGWNYTANPPARYDGSTDVLCPPRRQALLFLRFGDGADLPAPNTGLGIYADGMQMGFNVQVDDFGILVANGSEWAAGTRLFGPSGAIGGAYTLPNLAITVSITFGHRVRMASKSANSEAEAQRRLYLDVPGACLWLAHPGAIWEFNYLVATSLQRLVAQRGAAGGANTTPGILRDDRDSLALMHALAWYWYGSAHLPCQWTLRTCGFFESYAVIGGTRPFPRLGDVITRLRTSGSTPDAEDTAAITPNSPVTAVYYDHMAGTTQWSTDWAELDLLQ